jgi:hypothetical protein
VASMSGNRTHGYPTGCLVGNNRASNATVRVRSSGDRFFANALGCMVMGGRGTTAENANSNSISCALGIAGLRQPWRRFRGLRRTPYRRGLGDRGNRQPRDDQAPRREQPDRCSADGELTGA